MTAGCAICRRYSHSELPLCMLIPPARPISMGFSVPVRFRPWLPSGTLDYQESQLAAPSAGGIRIPSCRSACSYLQPVRYPWASAYRYASTHGCRPGLWITRKVSWLRHLPEVFAFRAAALHAHTSSPSDIHGLQRIGTLPPTAAVRDFGLPGKSAGCAICRRYSHSELPLCMLIPPARPISMGFSVPVRFRPWLPSGTFLVKKWGKNRKSG